MPEERDGREGASAPTARRGRSVREVFEDHLRLRAEGRLEDDIERNFARDVVVLHVNGAEHGHDGVRKSGGRLASQLPDADFRFDARHVVGPYAYLEWSARSDSHVVSDGADTFVIEDGRIVMQSIHYTLVDGGRKAPDDAGEDPPPRERGGDR